MNIFKKKKKEVTNVNTRGLVRARKKLYSESDMNWLRKNGGL